MAIWSVYAGVIKSHGLTKSESVNFPVPPVPNYHASYDSEQLEVMRYWEWTRSDLLKLR